MNRISLFLLAATGVISHVLAAPTDAPVIDGRAETLQKRITGDLQSGKLTKVEGDVVQHELDRITKTEERVRKTGTITPRTRKDLRTDLDKLEKDIERKENQPKPTPSPATSLSAPQPAAQ